MILLLASAGCSYHTASRLPSPGSTDLGATATATATGTATSSGSAADRDVVGDGYRALVRGLVLPVPPDELLKAAWSSELTEAHAEGFQANPSLPQLGTDAGQDLTTFNQARDKLLASTGASLNAQKMDSAALVGMAESVEDCHTAYLSADQWDSISGDLAGDDTIDSLPLIFQLAPPFLIESVDEGSNAAAQGVQPGDRILEVNGTLIAQIPLSQRKFIASGGAGTSVVLTLQSQAGNSRTVTVNREAVSRPVLSTQLYGQVGYIRLRTFTENLDGPIDSTIAQLQGQGAKAFVLDLRGNLGGELNSVAHVLSRFIPSGELAATNERNRAATTVSADGSVLPGPPPLAVLVDGGSLSASELFASDIQQYGAGELVGTPTPGCLLGSTFRVLGDGSAMQVSVVDVRVGPQQVVVNNAGVQPDVTVPITRGRPDGG